ncbi:TonB-dependent receptor SusC [Elysia marginata]|uniref:TonB-dependent receptor SusC n=1 Tax=Elysia marginata TaxID=1093978 RepID=A0AAV4FYY0_9GAST|nr:TonB-dependent receptor SusC [Elysia marginata]
MQDPKAMLIVSFLGYEDVEVSAQDGMTVSMKSKSTTLQQVIVTGYGTQKKESITGSVSVLNVEDVSDMPDGNALRKLQGRVTGVQIGKSGGPGGNNIVRIRGFSNLSTNGPLYIIDGLPTQDGALFNAINPADIESMQVLKDAASAAIYGARSNNGVVIITTKKGASKKGKASMKVSYTTGVQQVRKEAFPSFLTPTEYGQWLYERFENGKEVSPLDSEGKPKEFSSEIYGEGKPVNPKFLMKEGGVPDLASAGEYDMAKNAIKKFNEKGTNWLHEIFRSGVYHDANVSVSKSSDNSSFYFSASYYKNEGVMKNTSFDRMTARMNGTYRVNDWITVGENFTVSRSNTFGLQGNQSESGPLMMAMRINPMIPLRDIKGNFGGTQGKGLGNPSNPVADLYRSRYDKVVNTNILAGVYARLDLSNFAEGLSLEQRANIDIGGQSTFNYVSKTPERSEPVGVNRFIRGGTDRMNQTYTSLIKYNREFGESAINVLGGVEYIQSASRSLGAERSKFFSDNINYRYLNAAEGVQTNSGSGSQTALFSQFLKVDYAYGGRYFVTGIVRNDQTSRFLGPNRTRLFPSVGFAWRLSEESFMQNIDAINNLKLRVSVGQTGNQATNIPYPAYTYQKPSVTDSSYSLQGLPNSVSPGFSTGQDGNKDLKWEVVTSTDVGFELGLFNGKLNMEGAYYVKTTDDMLVQVPRAGVYGLGINPWKNVGTMENKGFEFLINHSNTLDSGINYSIGVNFSRNVNTVISLMGDDKKASITGRQFRGHSITRIMAGQPITYFYGYKIDPSDRFIKDDLEKKKQLATSRVGGFKYQDINGDKKVDANDRTFLGSPLPDFIYGINMSVGYKGLSLSTFLEGSQGNEIFNQTRYFTDMYAFTGTALSRRVLQSYGKEGVSNPIFPKNSSEVPFTSINHPSSYYVEDASYLRVRNVQLTYTFPKSMFNKGTFLEGAKLFFQVENAYVFTKYTGLDPEINIPSSVSSGASNIVVAGSKVAADANFNMGIDQGSYPNPRSFVFGISMDL